MATNFVKDGTRLTYINNTATAIKSGDVVVMGETSDATIGIALVDIAIGDEGEIAISGVWKVPKVSAATFKMGESVLWDSSEKAFDSNQAVTDTGDIASVTLAAKDGIAGESSCWIKLLGIPGVLN